MSKLQTLLNVEGYGSLEELVEAVFFDSVCPAICMNIGCDYTAEMEPDQDRGWCEACGMTSMKSALILAGFM